MMYQYRRTFPPFVHASIGQRRGGGGAYAWDSDIYL